MPQIYTWSSPEAVTRKLTVGDIIAAKGKRKFTQVNASSEEEAAAANAAGIDMVICDRTMIREARQSAPELFLTAVLPLAQLPSADDVLRAAFAAMADGADGVFTQREPAIVEVLARAGIPTAGHVGLVPRKSGWIGGLRAFGKTSREGLVLLEQMKRFEDAGAWIVEVEVVPANVLAAISPRTGLVTISLGSGPDGDVAFLFMRDICGEDAQRPRHARAFGDLLQLRNAMSQERVAALTRFREAVGDGSFPAASETVSMASEEFDQFLSLIGQSEAAGK